MTAHDLFHAGKLKDAIAAQVEEVRNHPTDTGLRLFLSELLCFAGDFERADTQIDAMGHQDTKMLPFAMVYRHLIRAAQARQDFYKVGRVPEFLGRPEGSTRLLLEASVLLREGATVEAAERRAQAEAESPKVSGMCDDQPFDDFRDLDDMTFAFFEVFTSKGEYYWIPIDRVDLIEFKAPERPRDLLWRPARMVVRNGPDGEVYLPVLYPNLNTEIDESLRLGRTTEWLGGEGGTPVRGAGQRTFLVGENAIPLMEMNTVTFDSPPGVAAESSPGT